MRVLVCLLFLIGSAAAQGPAPVSSDLVLTEEQAERAASLSAEFRCVVCKNQSIAESDAELAQALRRLVEERVAAGDSDTEVRAYLTDRYGEFVLLKPRLSLRNAGLWISPLIALALGGIGVFLFVRGRPKTAASAAPLTEEERAEIGL